MDPREDKLPLWAQKLLKDARYRADTAEERLNAHLQTVEPSAVWFGDYQNKVYLPDERGFQQVHFSVTGQPAKSSYDEVQVGWRKDLLHISASRPVSIQPIGSNCFDLQVRDY